MSNSIISINVSNNTITIDYSHGHSYLSVAGSYSLYGFEILLLTRAEADERPTLGFHR